MKAMILAAGRGTRLGALSKTVPKVMQTIAGKPLIGYQLEWLHSAGVTDVVINLHHLGEQIRDYVGDGKQFGLAAHYSPEETLLETGGGIVAALPKLGTRPFLILLGDIFTDFPFVQFAKTLPTNSLIHLLLTPTPAFRDRGDFNWTRGLVTGRGNSHVYCGLALLDPSMLAGRAAEPFSLREPLFEAVSNKRVTGQVWDGYWTDIGTPEQLRELRERFDDVLGARAITYRMAVSPGRE